MRCIKILNLISIYTDGACAGNQFKENYGGWGVVIIKDNKILKKESGAARKTTNNRMELFAIIKALEFIQQNESKLKLYQYGIHSDSAYIINCLHQKWYQKWQKNGWVTSKNKPVKNKDLWNVHEFYRPPSGIISSYKCIRK